MKARFLITALTTLLTLSLSFAQADYHSLREDCDFKPGEQVFVFGNKVKLRSAPQMESEVLGLLRIGEWIEIIEKTEFSWPYKGYDSPFYKVKYDTEEGYILGGLLSMERKTLNNTHYYFARSREGKKSFLNIRHVVHGDYAEQKVALSNPNFRITILDNKGISDLEGILYIDYQAETSGDEGGGVYLFDWNNQLLRVAELSKIQEAGTMLYTERFVFPNDEGGIPEKILFVKQQSQNLDEPSQWTQNSIESRQLSWVNGNLMPDFREKAPN